MAIKEINTEGVDKGTALQFIESYKILKSEVKAEIEDNPNMLSEIYNALVELRIINYDFIIKDIIKLTLCNAHAYIIYNEVIVPYKQNPGSMDTTSEISHFITLGYARLNMIYSGFIVTPKVGVDKTRTFLNRFFQKGSFKDNKNDRLFHDGYLVQGDKAAFERFASDEIKKGMLKLKDFNFLLKGDTLIAWILEDFKVENVIALSNFFKTIQPQLG